MVLPSASAGFWAAVGLQRCMYNSCLFVARSRISVSSAVTALLANRTNFASHNASHNSDLIGRRNTCKSQFLRMKVIPLPLSLGPVPFLGPPTTYLKIPRQVAGTPRPPSPLLKVHAVLPSD